MIFHVVAIKELQDQSYNVDVLVECDSQDFVKDFLRSYNMIVLEVSEYIWEISSFWNVELVVWYEWQDIKLYSSLNNLRIIVYNFIMVWFDVKYINFTDYRKMKDEDALAIIKMAQNDVENQNSQIENSIVSEDRAEKEIYHDAALERAICVAEWQINDINRNIYTIWSSISSRDLRDIKNMEQELAKLKMGRNIEKIVDFLEKILNKSWDIKQKYLSSQRNTETPIFSWSVISNVDVQYELNNLDKAKNLKEIWRLKTWNDYFYSVLGSLWIQLRFFWRDLLAKMSSVSQIINWFFGAVDIFIILMIIICAVDIVIVSLWSDPKLYFYVMLVQFGLAWLIEYWLQFIKKWSTYRQLILVWIWILSFVVIYNLIKYCFVF